jgi:hypothetical protein
MSGVRPEYFAFLIISTAIATIVSFLWVWRMWYKSHDDTLGKGL